MAKRILALLMVMLMLVGMMACNKEEEETPTGSESDVAGEAQTGDPSQDPYLLTLDSSLNFNGEEITILQRKAKQDEMYAEELVGDIISDAIYTRNKAVEGKLGVRFKFQTADGTNTTYEAANGMAADLMNSLQAGIDGGYDLVSNYTAKAVALITKGAYLDFKDIPHVDMTRGWWDQDFITTSTYKDKVYSLVGAANITTTEGMYVMFVNFDLAEDTLGEQDFYQQVFDGEWTYEEMMQCLSSMGDGSSTGVYAMGLGNSSASVDGFLQSLNVKIVEKTPQGVPTVVMQDELNSTILDSLKELYHRNKSVIYDGTSSFGGQKAFQEGRAMFYVERMSFAKTYLQDATFKYGILALPKWDEDSDYRVATHNEHSCFNVMKNLPTSKLQAVGAVAEYLTYESYKTVYPAVFEKAYKQRYTGGDPLAAQMFDFLVSHRAYDFGYLYHNSIGTPVYTFRNYVKDDLGDLTSSINAGNFQTKLDEFIAYYN